MNRTVIALLSTPGLLGIIAGAGIAPIYRLLKIEVVLGWRTFCAFAHRAHVKQTTLDDGAINLLDRARPALDAAMDEARAGLVTERATAAAMEADTTPQSGSLMPVKVDVEPLAPVVAAVAVEATLGAAPAVIAATVVAAP